MSKEYWNKKGEKYKNNWIGKSDQKISEKEMSFVMSHVPIESNINILDVGCGTGRVLGALVRKSKSDTRIFGIDYAKEMVEACEKKFFKSEKESKVKDLRVCDASEEDIPFDECFTFITSIRVLKYNKNWKEIIKKINSSLESDGKFVFTMPNKYSASYFSDYGVPIYLTSVSEVKETLEKEGFVLENAVTFSRIPRNFYLWCPNSSLYHKILIFLESFLAVIFGKHLFGKIIFFVAKKI